MVVRVDERLLARLFDRRQEDAARILGMSLTSLKMACRRLGIKRWPYSRYEPPSEEILSNSSSQAAVSQLSVQQAASQPEGAEGAEGKEAADEDEGKEEAAEGDGWLDWYMGCEMMEEDVSYPITQNIPN
ncbi:hypothetical protein GUITHDRAFT_119944 [Guillardia theta CCMP2712]|uniref:RWP-RK domain-containing protein n=1 Tax=Guillardia theta (strain CCMP2712) TaxID=905079 RepID=L1ID59_GUITC|nr:hypothetical protein GUITHDRAFT_119944 [Guillardia theta CCMP2712]EKX33834.1 hypothetical protein GUITHDRAFT_119944 [Guillardia theta CCMP2712]|eukprot:XP_005820814.1 hypothetical protein GUITHDRAFT_119944 [Guillardia theta CCMP2712]